MNCYPPFWRASYQSHIWFQWAKCEILTNLKAMLQDAIFLTTSCNNAILLLRDLNLKNMPLYPYFPNGFVTNQTAFAYFYYLLISISFFTYLFEYMTSLHLANQSRLTASCWLADLIMSRSNKDESWWELAVTNCHKGYFRPQIAEINVRWLFQLHVLTSTQYMTVLIVSGKCQE